MTKATSDYCPEEPSNNHNWSTIGGTVVPGFMEAQETHIVQQCDHCGNLRKNNDVECLGDAE